MISEYTTLQETISLMISEDYQERFKAEYYQLKIRYKKLHDMIDNWNNLDFKPVCELERYNRQLYVMHDYLIILEERARLEKIEL